MTWELTHTVLDASGEPAPDVEVIAEPWPRGAYHTTEGTLVLPVSARSDENGVAVLTLVQPSDITVEGVVFRVKDFGGRDHVHTYYVSSEIDAALADCLVDEPGEIESSALALHVVNRHYHPAQEEGVQAIWDIDDVSPGIRISAWKEHTSGEEESDYDLMEATLGSRPNYHRMPWPHAYFDGGDGIHTDGGAPPAAEDGATMILLIAPDDIGSSMGLCGRGSNISFANFAIGLETNDSIKVLYDGSDVTSPTIDATLTTGRYHPIAVTMSADATEWWHEREKIGSDVGGVLGPVTTENFNFGSTFNDAFAERYNGSLAWAFYANVVLSDEAIVRVMTWLQQAYHDQFFYAAIDSAVPALVDLTDVTIPSPEDGEVVTWDAGTQQWIAAPGGGGAAEFVGAIVTSTTEMVESTETQMVFSATVRDTDGFVVGNTVVIPEGMGGLYEIELNVLTPYLTGAVNLLLRTAAKANGAVVAQDTSRGNEFLYTDDANVTRKVPLAAGDVITWFSTQQSGANRVPDLAQMSVQRVGD